MMKIAKLASVAANHARRRLTLKNFGYGLVAILALSTAYIFVPPPHQARAQFADQGTWAGTAAGTANAVVLNLANVSSLNDIVGVTIRFNPAANNTGPVTIVVQNALGSTTATALQRPSSIGLAALSLNELWAGETTAVTYNGSVFVLSSNVDMTPIGHTVEYRAGAAPRGALIEDGSCVSRTTFAPLFSVIGTTYSACDGVTTFGVPNSKGTVFAAADGQGAGGLQGRITTATCATPNTIGAVCGTEKSTVAQINLPNITLSTGITDTRTWGMTSINGATPGIAPGAQSPNVQQVLSNNAGTATVPVVTVTGGTISGLTPLGGSNIALATLNPALLGIRAIKY
jgi:microcystin-dependent protein